MSTTELKEQLIEKLKETSNQSVLEGVSRLLHIEEEMEGLDVGEHGMEAYSGFVKESDIVASGYYASSVDMETPSSR